MYPERDSRADEFDDAVERRRAGDDPPANDQDMQELVNLAARLEEELSDGVPDPEFRADLKHRLLQGDLRPQTATSEPEPVNLDDERWYRRLAASPWRASAAAAACLVVIVGAFMATASPFGGDSDDNGEEVTSFQAIDADATPTADSWETDQFPFDGGDDSQVPDQQWLTASFPPIDTEHAVLPPLLVGFLPFSERRQPRVQLSDISGMAGEVDMPSDETVYYLNAPQDGETMLTTLCSMLGIDGELIEGSDDGEPYRIVNDEQDDIFRWDPASAFLHLQGDALDEPINDLLGPEAQPDEVARHFLELIGFDLDSIDYEPQLVGGDGLTEVQFRPIDFPETGLDVTLGGSVFVDDSGAVREAYLYWLSLVDEEVVAMRESEKIIEDLENDSGYVPMVSDDDDELMIEPKEMKVVHVLTRFDDSHFVLQPAVKVLGEYHDDPDSPLPGSARYYVPAVENGD